MDKNHQDPEGTFEAPAWYDEIAAALAYSDHLVLSGNLADLYPVPNALEGGFRNLEAVLWNILSASGFGALVFYDPVNGLRIAATSHPDNEAALRASILDFEERGTSLPHLIDTYRTVTGFEPFRVALVIDYASHLTRRLDDDLDYFFVSIDLASRQVRQATAEDGFNPTFWLVDHPADLPDWFVLSNAFLREVQVEEPDLEDRFLFAKHLAAKNDWLEGLDDATGERHLLQFALECDGKPLVAMDAIAKVAVAEGFDLAHISDAIRVFRTGSRRNPWTSPVLQSRMKDARSMLEKSIKGQPHAIEKTLDILARSLLGLSAAQSMAMHTRPRGALFFVGPTGVGKTELAKAVTELLFADETLCHRFDMSEFMEENSISRLIGAPPGQPGHEKGGQLVNAAMRRPFSVFLFDEVEKAHPRVLDLFLQILDEGRLTDARGATAYFSEALLIFTSNIGIVQGSKAVNLGMNILPSDSHADLTLKITRAVREHFRNELQRPELLNRIGQNVVVFDFLSPGGMNAIFDSILELVLKRVAQEHRVKVALRPEARESLKQLCTMDLFEGGRGIANRIETHFINPLARQLFLIEPRPEVVISAIEERGDTTTLVIEEGPASSGDPAHHTPQTAQHRRIQPSKRTLLGNERWRARFDKRGS